MILAVVGAGGFLSACQKNIEGTAAAYADDQPAGVLYNRGLGYMNAGKFNDAIDEFNEVDRQHPYSEEARKSLIMSAFASYRRGDYDNAIASSKRYVTLYPGSDDAAYAQYIMGQCYFAQVKDITRDQMMTQQALDAMQTVIDRYPNSEYAADASRKVVATRDQLAGKEMQIGRYYLEKREYVAAINRFDVVVTQYQDTRHVEEALERLVEVEPGDGSGARGADRRRRARPQLPQQPLVQGRLRASPEEGCAPGKLRRTGGRRLQREVVDLRIG